MYLAFLSLFSIIKIALHHYFWFTISKPILDRELKKGGFEFDSLKRAWSSNGILEKNSQGRYVKNTKVYGSKGLYVTINIKDI